MNDLVFVQNNCVITVRKDRFLFEFIWVILCISFEVWLLYFLVGFFLSFIHKINVGWCFYDKLYYGMCAFMILLSLVGISIGHHFSWKLLFDLCKEYNLRFVVSTCYIEVFTASSHFIIDRNTFRHLQQLKSGWEVIVQENAIFQHKMVFRKYLFAKNDFKVIEQALLKINENISMVK